VDEDALPGYEARPMARRYSPGILHYNPDSDVSWWGHVAGIPSNKAIYRFYQDYHRHLREQGVDGVKVDNQASMEAFAQGLGGRVALMRRTHEALEGSVQTHFLGNLINCMSCSSDMLYSALNSTITRSSDDFYPNKPESHGPHVYINAQVSAWFGEFVQPDWDMFQSGHAMGPFHAMARAVGGCPVYVSDKPGSHDFALLRKLVLPDGFVLRCAAPGRPTRDCLFHDPTTEDVLLKIFNLNPCGGVVGVFNARHGEGEAGSHPVSGFVSPADLVGLLACDGSHDGRFAVYAHTAGALRSLTRTETWDITLEALTSEVFTVMPIDRGIGPIGLADYFNSGGAIIAAGWDTPSMYEVVLRAGGRLLAWSDTAPQRVEADEVKVAFHHDAGANRLEVEIPDSAPCVVRMYFA
jgi:raffinose synthase